MQSWTSTNYFLNSSASFVTKCQLSSIVDCDQDIETRPKFKEIEILFLVTGSQVHNVRTQVIGIVIEHCSITVLLNVRAFLHNKWK